MNLKFNTGLFSSFFNTCEYKAGLQGKGPVSFEASWQQEADTGDSF